MWKTAEGGGENLLLIYELRDMATDGYQNESDRSLGISIMGSDVVTR